MPAAVTGITADLVASAIRRAAGRARPRWRTYGLADGDRHQFCDTGTGNAFESYRIPRVARPSPIDFHPMRCYAMQHMIESLPPPRTVTKPSPGPAAERPYVSVSQAASMLGVSRVTIWRWIRAGRLHALRIGHRTIRIDQDQIDCARIQRNGAGIQARQAPVSNAEAADCAPWDLASGEHVVQFYERDAYLVDSVAALVSGAIAAGDAAIVVATPSTAKGSLLASSATVWIWLGRVCGASWSCWMPPARWLDSWLTAWRTRFASARS